METTLRDMSSHRAQCLARLAAERAFLLKQLEGLSEETLSQACVAEEWTAKDLLAHVGYWDAFTADRLSKLVDGRRAEIHRLVGSDALDERNRLARAQFAHLTFGEALAVAQKERRNLLLALDRTPDDMLHQRVRLGPGWRIAPRTWLRRHCEHDAGHAADLVRWRVALPPNHPSLRVIHRALLRPMLGLSRSEFLALAGLIPRADVETHAISGSWSLKQVLGHLSDYERLGVMALRAVAAGQQPAYERPIESFETYNNERGETWARTTWAEAWATFVATRRALLALTEALPDEALARPFAAPWPAITTACGYLLDMAQHEEDHADSLRRALRLPALPRRLGRQ